MWGHIDRRAVATPKLTPCPSKHVFGSRRPRITSGFTVRAAASTPDLQGARKPGLTGDILSRLASWAISTPPIYGGMKVMAKQAIKNTVERSGVPWDSHVREMEALMEELIAIKDELEDKSVSYPSYYLKPFHGYETGNLGWLQAFEVLPATTSVAIRTFKDEKQWTADKCVEELRGRVTNALKAYNAHHGLPSPSAIVDMGCSTGLSTQWLAKEFPDAASVTGLDLSPYFLAVAELDRRRQAKALEQQHGQGNGLSPHQQAPQGSAPIRYIHGFAENSPFADSSQDMVTFSFVTHECPGEVIDTFVKEAARILKPGGVLAFTDSNHRAPVYQKMPRFLYTLMKITEPWSDAYDSFDLEASMRNAGFSDVVMDQADPRHLLIVGIRR